MFITPRYAEDKLKTLCKKIESTPLGWVATYFMPGSEEEDQKEEVRLQLVVNTLKPLFEDSDHSHLYFCTDGGLIIVSREIKLDTLHEAIRHLSGIFPQTEESKHSAKIYDFSVQFELFKNLVERKKIAAEELSKAPEPEQTVQRVISVDPAYAQAMLEQRKTRKDTHIMLVEDDAFTLQLVTNVLKDYTTIRAMDGFDAVESYMLNAPDMVFLDIGLPTFTGHEVLEKILKFDPNAFIVMLSGNSYMEDISKSMKAGAKGFVAKPFPKEKLLNYVDIFKSDHPGKQ